MRRLSYGLLATVFAVLLFSQTGTEEDPFPLYNSPTLRVTWTNTCSAEDNVVALEAALCLNRNDTQNPVVVVVVDDMAQLQPGEQGTRSIIDVVTPLQDGGYWLHVRYKNICDVYSPWTTGVYCVKVWSPPVEPGGCSILR